VGWGGKSGPRLRTHRKGSFSRGPKEYGTETKLGKLRRKETKKYGLMVGPLQPKQKWETDTVDSKKGRTERAAKGLSERGSLAKRVGRGTVLKKESESLAARTRDRGGGAAAAKTIG